MTLVRANGTQLAESPGGTVLEPVAETDPKVKVLIDVYNASVPDGTAYPAQMTQKAFRAGQVIRQSQWDKHFVDPLFTSVSPSTGPAAGGTAITIMGDKFVPGAAVTVGGAAATSIVVVSPTKITAVTPAGTAGARDVVVTTNAGAVTKTGGFVYT